MRDIDFDELSTMAVDAKDALYAKAGGTPKIYLHWSAGHYNQVFDDYHINIKGNGDIVASTDDLSETLAHTYHRNTGAIGISLACGYGANTEDLGDEPPTEQQIENMAYTVAVLCYVLDIPIDKMHVMTHGEAADNEDGRCPHEPYGPRTTCERWDLEYLGTEESPSFNPWADDGSRGGDVIRGKANWYMNEYFNK